MISRIEPPVVALDEFSMYEGLHHYCRVLSRAHENAVAPGKATHNEILHELEEDSKEAHEALQRIYQP